MSGYISDERAVEGGWPSELSKYSNPIQIVMIRIHLQTIFSKRTQSEVITGSGISSQFSRVVFSLLLHRVSLPTFLKIFKKPNILLAAPLKLYFISLQILEFIVASEVL